MLVEGIGDEVLYAIGGLVMSTGIASVIAWKLGWMNHGQEPSTNQQSEDFSTAARSYRPETAGGGSRSGLRQRHTFDSSPQGTTVDRNPNIDIHVELVEDDINRTDRSANAHDISSIDGQGNHTDTEEAHHNTIYREIPNTQSKDDSPDTQDISGNQRASDRSDRDENLPEHDAATPDPAATLKLRLLITQHDGRHRDQTVHLRRNINLFDLKREIFPTEVAQGMRIRVVASGQLLQDANMQPLADYGVRDGTALHVAISPANNISGREEDIEEIDLGRFAGYILPAFLACLWLLFMTDRAGIFDNRGVLLLIVATAGWAAFEVSSRSITPNNRQPTQ